MDVVRYWGSGQTTYLGPGHVSGSGPNTQTQTQTEGQTQEEMDESVDDSEYDWKEWYAKMEKLRDLCVSANLEEEYRSITKV